MRPERTLLAVAGGVLLVAVVAVLVAPGALASPQDDVRRPGPVRVAEVAISPGSVSGGTAELLVDARIDHAGNPTENVSVRFRAVDAESGFVARERVVDLGTLDEDGWTAVNTSLRVDREGGYVVEATVFRDREPVTSASKQVSGLAALTPEYARTSVAFTESAVVPPVAVSVADVSGDRTTLDVSASLTNSGDAATGDLRVEVVLRQADSNIVADRASVDVGRVRPGRTESRTVTVTVPSEYNYYVDLVLLKDGVLVDTARSVANLDPTERISANVTEREVEFEVSDFEADERTPRGAAAGSPTPMATPGFGAAVALAALAALAVLAARTRRNQP